jgi:hypothetical protein
MTPFSQTMEPLKNPELFTELQRTSVSWYDNRHTYYLYKQLISRPVLFRNELVGFKWMGPRRYPNLPQTSAAACEDS